MKRDQVQEAFAQFQKAVAVKPENAEAHINLGNALSKLNRPAEADDQYRLALRLDPGLAEAHSNLGNALRDAGRIDDAVAEFQEALRLKPESADAHYGLGVAWAESGRLDDAIAQYQQAIAAKPDYADAYYGLGGALIARAKYRDAVAAYRKVLEIESPSADVCNNLAQLLATCPDAAVRNGAEAIAQARQAVELSGGQQPRMLETLAAAYAEAGRFREALQTAQRAFDLAVKQNNPALAEAIRARLRFYQAGSPSRLASPEPDGKMRNAK
jgi:protein O-mannosyl-transferase